MYTKNVYKINLINVINVITSATDTSISSPSTSSSVAETSEQVNCRGIINPNYPGFQHLAHTLSEHFFDDHHFAQSSEDSDLSEFEVEHDRGDFTHAAAQQFQTLNRPCGNHNNSKINTVNNNNNNNVDNSDTLKKIEDLIRGAFHSRESEPPGYAESISSGYSRIMDLSTDNAIDGEEFHAYSVLDSFEMPSKENQQTIISNSKNIDEGKSSTPDILRKTNSKIEHLDGHAPPDILQNVMDDSEQEEQDDEDDMVEKALDWIYIGKDGALLEEVGDIVGDFEQEVQHELGRIVSGYSNNAPPATRHVIGSEVLLVQQETLACLLSNADKMERLLEKVFIIRLLYIFNFSVKIMY